jgi:DNA-binding IclR family transcriptional regulator/nitroimidazol reductase NimA-like FMN-containing flavoprotein (pyridoxamine 5'-phosphate oxidase superfamily)
MLNERSDPPPPYQQEVPAVRRAARVLERLAEGREPFSLTALSRAVGVAPSTLLGILTTLRTAGLVARHDTDGRYTLGPTLIGLGAAAGQRYDAVHVFDLIAGRLVETVGETVLLWMRHEDAYLLAAARDGTQSLRYVPRLGLRLEEARFVLEDHVEGSDQASLYGGDLEPGVWMVAAPLPSGHTDESAMVAVAGPASRLRGTVGSTARQTLIATVDDVVAMFGFVGLPPSDWERAGRIEPAELDGFLRQSRVANLSYVSSDGYPATVPLWYAWDGVAFWLAPRPGAEWAEHVCRDPRVSLAVTESAPPLRRVLVRGRIEPVDQPTGTKVRAIRSQLAARYAGFHAVYSRGEMRDPPIRLLKLAPERMIAWRGLLRHPLLPGATAAPRSGSPSPVTRRGLGYGVSRK